MHVPATCNSQPACHRSSSSPQRGTFRREHHNILVRGLVREPVVKRYRATVVLKNMTKSAIHGISDAAWQLSDDLEVLASALMAH